MKILVIQNFYNLRHQYEIARLILVDGLLIGWLIYGNQIYYSKDNDCGLNERTQFLSEFMGCILFIGYLMIGLYTLLICTVPCLYLYMRHVANEWQL